MASTMTMSSTSISFSRQPDVVADKVLRRAELGKMARRLQNSLALAKFKTTHGLEELTLDSLEPRFEEERRRRRMLAEGDMLSDSSSSSASDLPYYPTSSSSVNRALTSSPLKATGPVFFSDAIGPSSGGGGGSTGHHRKRTYMATFDGDSRQPPHYAMSSPSKRFRASPTPRRVFNPAAAAVAAVGGGGGGNLDLGGGYGGSTYRHHNHNQLAQSSPIKPRRQKHFTTSTGPDVSLFKGSHRISEALVVSSPPPINYAANLSDDDDDLLPAHSFAPQHGGVDPDAFSNHSGAAATAAAMRSSPPQTPPMRNRSLARSRGGRNNKSDGDDDGALHQDGAGNNGKTGEDAADLLLYLAASPSPATRSAARRAASSFSAAAAARMDPPSTPPPKMGGGGGGGGGGMALPSSMMTTPGGGNPFPATPSFQTFDFADFVNITPSPAPVQRGFKTPVVPGTGTGRTPISETRRRLTFDEFP